jgi:two-component system, cell cycle sensor histidine kinase and response regulator CckA
MEAIGQLAGGVAHDFNNLLAVILGNTELVRMSPALLSDSAAEHLKEVVDAANRAATLTRQLLSFSRKEVVQARPLDLNKHIGNLANLLKRTIRENVELRYAFAEDLSLVQADPGMLDQVLMNLVVNSRDAMPGGGDLRIATHEVEFDAAAVHSHPDRRLGRFVCVSVADSGGGIAPENLAHIFEPFFTTKEVGKGTGLGLATVFGVVKQHRGWVEVTSKVGVGTKFEIFLPALDGIGASSAQSPQSSAVQGGHEVVLMVEDDDSVRRIFRRVLEEAGYRLLEASCGREALDVWERHRNEIRLLLTDVVMPGGIDGRDLAERLIAVRPNLKVLFMTGYSGDILGENSSVLKRANSRMLKKPCNRKEFLRVVREHLDDGNVQRTEKQVA